MSRALYDNDPPLTAQEALLDVVGEWAHTLTHSQRVQLSESITRILALRPGWPITRVDTALIAEREGAN